MGEPLAQEQCARHGPLTVCILCDRPVTVSQPPPHTGPTQPGDAVRARLAQIEIERPISTARVPEPFAALRAVLDLPRVALAYTDGSIRECIPVHLIEAAIADALGVQR